MFRKIARDKWKHFFVGIPLGAVLQTSACYVFEAKPGFATVLALIMLLVICYGFELFSRITGKGHYEIWDAIAGVLGGVIGMAGALYMILLY